MARRGSAGREGETRAKLRTSRELHDQIRHDPRLDPAAFVIGYATRDTGIQEIGLPSFDPEGEIPWHRIRYIRRGTTTVWDRRLRVDLLAGQRRAPAPAAPCGLDAAPVHRSAVAVIPPEGVWPPIQAIRQLHDRHVGRWMPHLNLLYGFLPEAAFAEAKSVLVEALRDVSPFEVTLDEVRRFQHRSSMTAWLHPRAAPPGALEALQAKLEALFPQCREQSSTSAGGFTPHLSIAQLGKEEDAEARMSEWQRLLPITFWIREIHLISRREDEPFSIRHTLPLAGGPRCDDRRRQQT
jgi:uncharacterized protein (UPF0248 family)